MEVTEMNQRKKTFAVNEDFRRSLTHERPEPRDNAPAGRQKPRSIQKNTNVSGREGNSKK
jgi:hypothetical protein